MQYIEAVSDENNRFPVTLFLAGGITGCRDWQLEIIPELKDLPVTIYNPRRANFPIHDPNAAREQITWEYNKLGYCNHILFWFCRETMCPIVLYELGRYIALGKARIFIGMDPEYQRRQDVEIQSELALPGREIFYSMPDLITAVRASIRYATN